MSAFTFKTVLVWAVPAMASLAVYSNGLNGDFVFDDMVAIVRNKVGVVFLRLVWVLALTHAPTPAHNTSTHNHTHDTA